MTDRITESPNCPEPRAFARLAAGLCGPEQSGVLLEHAAHCQLCAERLSDLIDAVSDDVSIDDVSVDETSLRSARVTTPIRTPRTAWYLAIAATLLASAGIAAWMVLQNWDRPPLTELASAYSLRRVLELQVPGAASAPLKVERSVPTLSDLPSALLDSQSRIRNHLERHPADPAWLHAQGRAALLVSDFDSALRSFQTASDLGEKSPDFYVDFASAYFERAERNGDALDYTLALEKLGQALHLRPDNLPALFNRAVVRAKLAQYDLAASDFEEYIRRTPDPGWREEARRRLADVQGRRSRVFGRPVDPPKEVAAEFALEAQMTEVLRAYFGGQPTNSKALAMTFAQENQDPWLQDVTSLPADPSNLQTITALSDLAHRRTIASSDYASIAAEIGSLQAADLPLPLRVWRDYELLYHTARTPAVSACPGPDPLISAARPYAWLQAQVLIEESLCAVGRQDFGAAFALIDRAEQVAIAHHFLPILIRVDNVRAQRLADTGFNREAIQIAVKALEKLEVGGYPLRRSYDFHSIISRSALHLNLLNTAEGAAAMTVQVSRGAGLRLFEMIGDSRQAQFDLVLGRKDDALRKYSEARNIYHELGESREAAVYWRVAQAGWLETQGDRAALLRMLDDARKESPPDKDSLYFTRPIFPPLCRVELHQNRPADVEILAADFQRQIDLAVAAVPGTVRAYLPEIESIARCLTAARLEASQPERALAAWQGFIGLDERVLGGRQSTVSQSHLQPGAAVLTIAELDGRAAVWLRSSHGVDFHWAPGTYTSLLERVRLLRREASLEAVAEDRIASDARQLFSTLFPKGIAGATRIGVQAPGELNILPLSLFSYHPEGKEVAFSFLPFGGGLPDGPKKHERITTVAATAFGGKWKGLGNLAPSVEEEANSAASAFRNRVALHGLGATARALDDAALTPGVLHFAGHAIPWRGGIGLLVAPDPADPEPDRRAGIWSMERPRPIKSDLVVFSGCDTAQFDEPGTVRPGQLSQAALLAGAQEVIASLWNVDSVATSAWMKRFYGQLAAGRTASSAVANAALEMKQDLRRAHPRYWAAFADFDRYPDSH